MFSGKFRLMDGVLIKFMIFVISFLKLVLLLMSFVFGNVFCRLCMRVLGLLFIRIV